MKPITFENLRRLIGGRRKNKDRNESPFKRSESFKRISIRRNYLENRGGQKGRNPTKRPVRDDDEDAQQSSVAAAVVVVGPAKTACGSLPGSPVASSRHGGPLPTPPAAPLPAPPPVRQIVAPSPPPPPPPQHQQAPSAAERKRQSLTPATPPPPPPPQSAGQTVAAPVIDYGEWIRCIRAEEDLNHLKKSSPPTPPARYRYHVHRELDDSSRTDSAISLGRIWMDAPMLPPAAPRSLELPGRPAAAIAADGDGVPQQSRRAHHSLESALKDKQRDDRPVPSRRFHRYPAAAMAEKTASRSSVASTCSGKDSGFSLSAPGLSDPPRPPKQLFRKKVQRRPAAGGATATTTAAVGGGKPPRRAASPAAPDQLYQVVVARSPLRQLKLDPMMFVPPERRRTVQRQQQHHHAPSKPRPAVVEVRDYYCVPKDARVQRPAADDDTDRDGDDGLYDRDHGYDDDEQDRLYESISKGCGRGRWQESTDDADTEDDDLRHSAHLHHHHHRRGDNNNRHPQQQQQQYLVQQQQQRTSAAVRNRVKRKKSARRNIKYVVKPVRRAPSVATRKPSVTAKSRSAWIATSTCV